MSDSEKITPGWEFEFRAVTPDGQVLTHKSYSAFEDMPTHWFGGHVNQVVDGVYNALKEKGYIEK